MAEGSDQRKSGRRRTLFGGVIFDENRHAYECSVSDISVVGAKVKADADLEIGSFVDLKINKFNQLRRSKVMWIRGGHIGLQFSVKIDKVKDGMSEFFKLMEEK